MDTVHFTRRKFLKVAAIAGLGLALPGNLLAWPRAAQAYANSQGLRKFAQVLRGVGPGGIPVAAPDAAPAPVTGVKHYTIEINQFSDQLYNPQPPDPPSALPFGPTTLWGYHPVNALGGGVQPQKHLGGIIVAHKDEPIQITFRNNLPNAHILPVDTTLMGADGAPNRTAVHLHGGLVPWITDGGPFAWWAPNGSTGESFLNNRVLNPRARPHEAEYYYPNQQSARFLWYHDHALGITRLNAYAGLATGYIIRDAFEADLVANHGLPDFVEKGGREIPIVIQDKVFVDSATIGAIDPTWPGATTSGTLWYPHVYEGARWAIGPSGNVDANGNLQQNPSVVAEMFGDTMLANGTVYPVVEVEARRYRLRILNACQARFLNLQLYVADNPDGVTYTQPDPALASHVRPTNQKGPDFLVIGTEGGFLSRPVLVNSATPFNIQSDRVGEPLASTIQASLLTGPALRWDVIVDFSGFEGQRVVLYNDAPAPFPMGEAGNDYYLGNPELTTQPVPGFGPDTRQIMAFDVGPVQGAADPPLTITPDSDLSAGIEPNLAGLTWTTQPQMPAGVKVRRLTLNEAFDTLGRLIQLLGTDQMVTPGIFGRHYDDPATEIVAEGSTEVWQIINLTGDTHPMHFHLVNVQVLSRQAFPEPQRPAQNPPGAPARALPDVATLAARGPDLLELGWKETVHMHPNEVTTVVMRFDLPQGLPFAVPESPRVGGHEYVWHCHILDHEEHDMMRPLIVTPGHRIYMPYVAK